MLKTYRILMSMLGRYERRRFYLLLIMVIVSSVLETGGVTMMLPFLQVLSKPEMIQTNEVLNFVYTSLGFGETQSFFMFLGAALFCILLLSVSFKAVTLYALTRFGVMRAFKISSELLRGSLYRPYIWFLGRHSSDLTTSVLTEVQQMVQGCLLPALQLLPSFITSVLIVGVILVIEPMIALSAVVLLGGSYVLIFQLLRSYIQRLGHERMVTNKARFRTVQEATGGIKELKLMGLEPVYTRRFDIAAFRMARIQSISLVTRQAPRFALEAIAFGGIILMLIFMIQRSGGDLSQVLPTLGFLVLALGRLLPALQEIYSKFSSLQFNDAVMQKIHGDLSTLEAPSKAKLARIPLPDPLGLRQSLVLERIGYSYPAADRPAISALDLTIPANTTVGLVGGTGAGKTTVIDLVLGLLTPENGRLLVDGAQIGPGNRQAWQRSIGYVPQQIYLIDDTVAANIAFGLPPEKIDMEAVRRAAKIASLHDFVETEMPKGYDTFIGEAGVRLSGGQRQRVGIARALYHDPDVLIMDEATSALDNLTERAVMEAVHDITGQKTIIMIAHRLSTIRNCDRIFVLEKGRIIASGTYDDLLEDSLEFSAMAGAAG